MVDGATAGLFLDAAGMKALGAAIAIAVTGLASAIAEKRYRYSSNWRNGRKRRIIW